MSRPTVAIIGASGYVGKFLTESFITALNDKKVNELRVITTKKSYTIDSFVKNGAKVFIVDFSKIETLVQAFTEVNIVISALGTGTGSAESGEVILNAMTTAGVKIYFPSEFGTNHYNRVKNYTHTVFEAKKDHFKQAEAKGLKTIRILCSDIMESTFGKWFGLDSKKEVWTLVGKGETPVAVTAEKDVGRFTVEAALLAFKDPTLIPNLIEVYSDMRTLKEYAKVFDKVAGRSTKLEFTSLDEALSHYESTQHQFEYLLQILFEEGAYDYTNAKGNELLNPGEKLWKLKKIEEYAQETQGRPWKDFA